MAPSGHVKPGRLNDNQKESSWWRWRESNPRPTYIPSKGITAILSTTMSQVGLLSALKATQEGLALLRLLSAFQVNLATDLKSGSKASGGAWLVQTTP